MQDLIQKLILKGFTMREQAKVIKVGAYTKVINLTLVSNRETGHAFMFSENNILDFVTITAMVVGRGGQIENSVFVNEEQVTNYCNKLNNFKGF